MSRSVRMKIAPADGDGSPTLPPPVMTGEQIFEMLGIEYDERALKYWRDRRGMPSFCLWANGEEHRRYLTESVMEWMREGASKGKANG